MGKVADKMAKMNNIITSLRINEEKIEGFDMSQHREKI
jgi:hypothetical protein